MYKDIITNSVRLTSIRFFSNQICVLKLNSAMIAVFAVVFFLSPGLLAGSVQAQENVIYKEIESETTLPAAPEIIPGLKISGLLRNDAYYIRMPDHPVRADLFADTLEARLILDRSRDDWSFYADGRLYINTGEFQAVAGLTSLKLMRAFVRYFSPVGDFTLGKTYVNFGTAGLFNPFEIDKSVQFTDLQYARQGIYAIEYFLPWQDLSGLKVFAGYGDSFNYKNTLWGISPGLHLGKFDLGAVWNHTGENQNVMGLFFKGDAFVGIQGAWGVYINDKLKYSHSEASAGVDYSFFDGDLMTSFVFYYNENGADNPDDYSPSPDSFLLARYYGLLSVVWSIDEFWSVSANAFMNFVDMSLLLLPGVNFTVTNGLNLTLQIILATAENDSEFSRDTLGDVSALIRVEGKF